MKKALMALTIILVLALVAACGGSNEENNNEDNDSNDYDRVHVLNPDYNGDYDNDFDDDFDWGWDDDFDFDLDFGFGGGDWYSPLGDPNPELVALVHQLYEGVEGVPMTESWEMTSENFSRFVFIDYIEGSQGIMSQAMINVIPHALVLLELPQGMDAAAVAAEIEAAADPNKWICVAAEKLGVFYSGRFIVMAMSWEEVVDGIEANIGAVLG